jgi:hypothetical protein
MRNKIYNTNPFIFHAQGRAEFCPLWEKVRIKCGLIKKIPDELQIVTFNNGRSFDKKKPGSLEESVQNQCVVMGSEIKDWKNFFKIQLTVDFLSQSTAKYVISADSSDVVVFSLEGIVDEFEKKKCGLLYNAEVNCWPVDSFTGDFERSKFKAPFCHLNAGAWIGRRDFALDFYRACLNSIDYSTNSEQSYIKKIYKQWYPNILIDDSCEIFQTLNRVSEIELEVL